VFEAGRPEGRLELGRLPKDLDHVERPAIRQLPAADLVTRADRLVEGARMRVRARVDEGKRAARLEPGVGQLEEDGQSRPRHVAQPEATEQGIDRPVW